MWNRLTPAQLTRLIDHCNDAVLILDEQGRAVAGNAAMQTLLGAAPTTVRAGHPLLTAGPGPLASAHPDGTERHLELRCLDLGDGLQARLFRDASAERRLERDNQTLTRQICTQSLADPVTGLLNPRGLRIALDPQVARCRRYGDSLSLVTMEVYGQAVDDDVLVRVSHVLKDQLRWADIVGCNEDHQFILALPETAAEAAMKMIDKVQHRLTAALCDQDAWTAYGIVEWDRVDDTQRLFERSLQALQQARGQADTCAVAL